MLVACIEHAAELRWAPAIKLPAVSWAGLVAVVVGELLRKAAMVRLLLDGFSCLLIGKIAWAACKLAHAALRCNESMAPLPSTWLVKVCCAVASSCSRPLLCPPADSGAAQLHAHDPTAQAARAHTGYQWCVCLGAAPGLCRLDNLGSGHAAAAVQPAVHTGLCCCGLALLRPADTS